MTTKYQVSKVHYTRYLSTFIFAFFSKKSNIALNIGKNQVGILIVAAALRVTATNRCSSCHGLHVTLLVPAARATAELRRWHDNDQVRTRIKVCALYLKRNLDKCSSIWLNIYRKSKEIP